jgi:hypothetical protein
MPQDLRMAVPRAYFDEHIDLLKINFTGNVAEFALHLDEVGSAD